MEVRGNYAAGEYGAGRLLLDGALVGSSNPTSDNWMRVSFQVAVGAGNHNVAVQFANDYYSPQEDRNLWVRRFEVRPLSLANAAPSDISLSGSSVPEHRAPATAVGIVSGLDPDVGQSTTLVFSLVSGYGDNALFSVDPATNELRTAAVFDYESRSSYSIKIRATDSGSPSQSYDEIFTISISDAADPAIASRLAFYNRSYFDGNDPAASSADDAAIATDKTALLPGQTASFANYTSYSRGLNGLMLDIAAAPGTLAADDFAFRVGNSADPATWATGPAPLSVTRRAGAGAGGSDRYTLSFADNAIAKQWLQVTVLANADTGLAAPDVFYFGNAVGESGNSAANAMVNSTDELGARNNPHGLSNRAAVTDAYDYNRDSLVNSTDQLLARNNGTGISTALKLIIAPGGGQASTPPGRSKLVAARLSEQQSLFADSRIARSSTDPWLEDEDPLSVWLS
jgi:hypothetical protein